MKPKEVKVRSERALLQAIIKAIDSGDDEELITLLNEYQRTYGEIPTLSTREVEGSSVDDAASTAGKKKSPLVDIDT